MNTEVLLELANRWDSDSKQPQCSDGSLDAIETNARADGRRASKKECAEDLRTLVRILGYTSKPEQRMGFAKAR